MNRDIKYELKVLALMLVCLIIVFLLASLVPFEKVINFLAKILEKIF